MDAVPDPRRLLALATMRMPFGKYKGRLLVDLPEPYVVWFHQNGYPAGDLGGLLRELYEIKLNGLEGLLAPLRPQPASGTAGEAVNGRGGSRRR